MRQTKNSQSKRRQARPKHIRLGIWMRRHQVAVRAGSLGFAMLVTFGVFFEATNLMRQDGSYQLSAKASGLVGEPVTSFGDALKLDPKTQKYYYNQDYTPAKEVQGQVNVPRFSAGFSNDPAQGFEVTDPVNQTTVKFKPKFDMETPRKDQNRLIYPLKGKNGVKVVSLQASGMKEDLVINKYQGDTLRFSYELELAAGLEARLESNGSLGIYGTDQVLLGNVQTGSEADAKLLEKARTNAQKTTLLFTIPTPYIKEHNVTKSNAAARFDLTGNILTIEARDLDKASYPLSIDPSVYVETAQKLMRGNNESNIDFDVSNELIQKGALTGARIPSWTNSLGLNAARWNHGTAVAGGYVYAVGGSSGSSNVTSVYWAKLNTSTYAIESPNPGGGTCSNWCTNTAYDLPAARAALSVVAYNGYLYAIGGVDGGGARTTTVYYAKIGANGEPISWNTTTALSAERSYAGAVAYNNRLYVLGGQTNASSGGVTTVEAANINPNGTLGSWSTTGMTALPSVRHNHSVQVYNNFLYLIGGNSSGTLQNSVHYIKINTDGTLASSWTATTGFTTARMAWGGSFSTIWGGYLYVAGGCTAKDAEGECTTISNDLQLASLNADGTITDWTTMTGVTSSRIGYGLVAWRNTLYGVGGCTAHNATTGACTTTSTTANYGRINQDGDISPVTSSVASGTSPCSGGTPTNCDLPPAGNGNGQGGRMSSGIVINNGYIYNIGGCRSVATNDVCETTGVSQTSDTISYAAVSADGSLVAPAVCTGTNIQLSGAWCVDNSHTLNGTTGLAAFGVTVFNNVMYVYGGTTGTDWQSSVWRTSLNADGSLNTWSTAQTAANLALGTARGYSYVFARANPSGASTYPGHLYIIGGCAGATTAADGLGCSNYYSDVYKCSITTTGALEEVDANDCTTAGQQQLDSEATAGTQGLGLMAGTVYANYIYLIAGSSPNQAQRDTVMYAKIDNSNNIVAASGGVWQFTTNNLPQTRRRGYAFGTNGYLYAVAGHDGNGPETLNDIAFAKVDVSSGDVGVFTRSTITLTTPIWDFRAVAANGYVYTFGGCSVGDPPAGCTTMSGSVQSFQVYNNYSGSPAAYTGSSQFTTDRIGGSAAIYNGHIYYAGGCTNIGCTTVTDNVQYAPLNNDGSVGAWTNTTDSTLPAQRAFGQLEIVGGTLYYIGGQDGTGDEKPEVYYGTPSSGNVSAWNTASNGLPADRTQHGATVWNNRIYVTGGLDDAGASTNTIYASPPLSTGGNIGSAWTATGMTAFNVARSGQTTIAYAGNLYILAGFDGTNYLHDVQYAQINADGTVDAWSYSTSLPQRIRQGDGFAANGYMYIFGGRSATSTCTTNTYVAPISANTTIASGNNPTGVGEWSQTNVKYTGDRYGVSAAYGDGRAYLVGGGCAGLITGADKVYYSSLQSQPQVARYSYAIDTDTDVFPTKWLMNGLDNDIGARWIMSYRSSTAAAAAWGQTTSVGAVTLGTPGTYTPRDGAGTNTNFARYYYLSVSIDSSQAFGYPEDVSRGPTIADLSLFFTSDPSKRLRHGKTFTGGQQQPLDTPF